jgi:hypothetical protein|tara:strand:- start:6100 stop:6603 length:504 start_codon:yes stop_codon:yes gene_type:complete
MYQFQINKYRKQKKEINRMGHWQGLQTKSGQERNFYVEDGKFYDSKLKRHEYRNCEPYDLVKDNTVTYVPKAEINPIGLAQAKPVINQEVKEENAGRFKALKTVHGDIAKALLSEEKLNHTSFTKKITGGTANLTEKKNTKGSYDDILKELLDNDIATKKGLNYVYK